MNEQLNISEIDFEKKVSQANQIGNKIDYLDNQTDAEDSINNGLNYVLKKSKSHMVTADARAQGNFLSKEPEQRQKNRINSKNAEDNLNVKARRSINNKKGGSSEEFGIIRANSLDKLPKLNLNIGNVYKSHKNEAKQNILFTDEARRQFNANKFEI